MATLIIEKFAPLLTRLFLILEPLTPRFVSFYLRRQLGEWKDKGLVNDYEVKARRGGKFHYKVNVNIVLTPEQTRSILKYLVAKISRRIGR